MRLFVLTLTILVASGCAGDPQPAVDDATAPVNEVSAAVDAPGAADPGQLIGTAQITKVMPPDWARVQGFTQQFYDGELDQLYASFSAGYKEEFSMQDLVDLRDKTLTEFGEEVEIVNTRKEENEGYHAYFRAARFSADERLIEVAFLIAPDESIAGLFITPDRATGSDTQ